MDEIFKKSGLIFSEVDFYDFVKNSIVQREEMKFQFTKNLSDSLELIAITPSFCSFPLEKI